MLKVWDEAGKVLFTANATPAGPTTPPSSPKTVALSRDGTRLAYHGWDRVRSMGRGRSRSAGCASGMSGRAGRCSTATTSGPSFYRAAFSPDGRRLPTPWDSAWWRGGANTGSRSGTSRRVENGCTWTCRPPTLAFSPDGGRLAGGMSSTLGEPGGGRRARVWDAATGAAVLTRAFPQAGSSAGLQPRRHVAGRGRRRRGRAGVIEVLDAATGRQNGSRWPGIAQMIWDLAFRPDGTRLASLAAFPPQAGGRGEAVGPRRRPGDADPQAARRQPRRE